jgi:hypothetical protein
MIDPFQTQAQKPPALAAQLSQMREAASASLKAPAQKPVAKPAAAQDVAAAPDDPVVKAETTRRQAAKDQARQRVMQLVEQLKALKQFASENPEVMAQQLARLAKELKSALAAYAEAGGRAGGWAGALNTAAAPNAAAPDQATKPASAQDTYRQMRDRVAGSEVASDMEFAKLVKGLAQTMRDLLTTAKIKTGVNGPGEEMKKDIEYADTTLKDLDKAVEAMSRDIRSSSPEAGLFVALYA